MFNIPAMMIDTIQNGKKQFITNYITDPALAKAWTDFVDTQRAFVHAMVKTTVAMTDVANMKVDRVMDKFPVQIDWMQAGIDAWSNQSNSTKSN